VAAPVAAALDLAGVEEHQIMPGLRLAVIDVRRVEIADPVGRVLVRNRVDAAPQARDGHPGRSLQHEPGSLLERHREVHRQAHLLIGKADTHWERLDQVLPLVAVEHRAGAEEELNGCIHRGLVAIVPVDPKECLAERLCLILPNRERQPPDRLGLLVVNVEEREFAVRRNVAPLDLGMRARSVGEDSRPAAVDQIKHVGGGHVHVPALDRAAEVRGVGQELVIDVVAGAVVSAAVGEGKRPLERDRHPHQVGALGD